MSNEVIRRFVGEKELAREMATSATPGKLVREYLNIPKMVGGLTIVDLASGGSSLTAELIREGADAHAVDALYGKNPEEIKMILEDSVDFLLRAQAPRCQFVEDLFFDTRATIDTFLASFGANPARFHSAYLTRLPFPDEFSDITVSLHGITALGESVDLMFRAVEEAVRVTKPGGKIILAPWSTQGGFFKLYAAEHDQVLTRVREKVPVEIILEKNISPRYDISVVPMDRLTFVKPM